MTARSLRQATSEFLAEGARAGFDCEQVPCTEFLAPTEFLGEGTKEEGYLA